MIKLEKNIVDFKIIMYTIILRIHGKYHNFLLQIENTLEYTKISKLLVRPSFLRSFYLKKK